VTDTTASVALVGHRLAEEHPTGIGRYYQELITALHRSPAASIRATAASTREAVPPAWAPTGLARATIGGPRKLRAVGWALTGRPTVDGDLGRPDLVHLLHPWTALPTRAPQVVTVHDLMPLQHPRWYGRAEAWLYARGVRFAVDHAERFIVNSSFTASELSATLGVDPGRVRVTWFGVGEEFRARHRQDVTTDACARYGVEPGRYVIAVGAVSERKNLGTVLTALARLDPSIRPMLLAAGPPGEGSATIHATVDRLGLRGEARFPGFVDHADLPVLVGAARALVHPSRAEGFGLTPLEAMAAGVPALVSDVGAVREVVGDAAVVLPPADPDAWAEAIEAVVTDDDHHRSLVDAGRARQARFTWDHTAAATAAVYHEVLGR
jgi:glycosyltransferase involved in cell wall biosynthesis